MVYNANAIPIPWIRPAWPRVARHFTRLATAEAQGAGTSHDSKEWTSPPRGTGLRSPSLAHNVAHAASRQTNEERRPLKRETRQWIALDKHHQAAGPELELAFQGLSAHATGNNKARVCLRNLRGVYRRSPHSIPSSMSNALMLQAYTYSGPPQELFALKHIIVAHAYHGQNVAAYYLLYTYWPIFDHRYWFGSVAQHNNHGVVVTYLVAIEVPRVRFPVIVHFSSGSEIDNQQSTTPQ